MGAYDIVKQSMGSDSSDMILIKVALNIYLHTVDRLKVFFVFNFVFICKQFAA
jgi:hypothetical protein